MDAERSVQLVEAGLWLQMSGDVEGARRLFEQALKLDPSNSRARELLDGGPFGATSASTTPRLADSIRGPSQDAKAIDRIVGGASAELPTPLPGPGAPWTSPAFAFAPDATSAWDSQSNPGVHLSAAKPGLGDVMDMLAGEVPPGDEPVPASGDEASDDAREEIQTLIRGARDLIELDDHTGAMDLILKAQALAPDHPEILFLRDRSEQTLQTMFESKLGAMDARPRVILKQDEIIWLNLDHRAGFVLAQIDGTVTFEDLFEVCGMSRLDTARILAQLVDEGVIAA
jgi:tetratricopeptide (TPR) repeat protein